MFKDNHKTTYKWFTQTCAQIILISGLLCRISVNFDLSLGYQGNFTFSEHYRTRSYNVVWYGRICPAKSSISWCICETWKFIHVTIYVISMRLNILLIKTWSCTGITLWLTTFDMCKFNTIKSPTHVCKNSSNRTDYSH
jgi:hypothetical protein